MAEARLVKWWIRLDDRGGEFFARAVGGRCARRCRCRRFGEIRDRGRVAWRDDRNGAGALLARAGGTADACLHVRDNGQRGVERSCSEGPGRGDGRDCRSCDGSLPVRRCRARHFRNRAASVPAMDSEGYAGCGAAIRDMDIAGRISGIVSPTLVVTGTRDTSTPFEPHGAFLVAQIPGAITQSVEAAHLAPLETPEPLAKMLNTFLR